MRESFELAGVPSLAGFGEYAPIGVYVHRIDVVCIGAIVGAPLILGSDGHWLTEVPYIIAHAVAHSYAWSCYDGFVSFLIEPVLHRLFYAIEWLLTGMDVLAYLAHGLGNNEVPEYLVSSDGGDDGIVPPFIILGLSAVLDLGQHTPALGTGAMIVVDVLGKDIAAVQAPYGIFGVVCVGMEAMLDSPLSLLVADGRQLLAECKDVTLSLVAWFHRPRNSNNVV